MRKDFYLVRLIKSHKGFIVAVANCIIYMFSMFPFHTVASCVFIAVQNPTVDVLLKGFLNERVMQDVGPIANHEFHSTS